MGMQWQVLEVAIGLFAAYFVVATIGSAIVEFGSSIFGKRSKDLNTVIDGMIGAGNTSSFDLRKTSVYEVMMIASRRKRGPRQDKDERRPSYMSARSFADAVVESLVTARKGKQSLEDVVADLPNGPLRKRLETLIAEFDGDLASVKAGLENWFDDSMDRLQGAYTRWSRWILLAVGMGAAVVLNVSTIRIVDSLWNDGVVRSTVADAAGQITAEACPADKPDCSATDKIEAVVGDLDELGLPVGWGAGWADESGWGWTWLGFLPTGFAVMMGAPFWFNLLTKATGLRDRRGVPPRAGDDPASATTQVRTSTIASAGRVTAIGTTTPPSPAATVGVPTTGVLMSDVSPVPRKTLRDLVQVDTADSPDSG